MLKYKSVTPQFEWKYEELILTDVLAEKAEKYMSSGLIKGKFITTEKPLKNNMGVWLMLLSFSEVANPATFILT